MPICHGLVRAVYLALYMVSSTPCDAFIACLCLVSFKGTDETPWLGSKPVCLARASQRLLALWHVFNHAFAGQHVTFVRCMGPQGARELQGPGAVGGGGVIGADATEALLCTAEYAGVTGRVCQRELTVALPKIVVI
jgi:hypothetical protein